jgi:hypothetical protein
VDLVVERDQHAEPARRWRQRDAHGAKQVHAGIAAQRARWPLGADHDDGLVGLEGEMEEVGRLLQRGGAVRNDKAGKLGPLGGKPMDNRGEL